MPSKLERLNTRLQAYYDAETAILSGAQSYKIGTRELSRADLKEIRAAILHLENEVAAEESRSAGKGRNKTFGIVPRDL